MTQDLEGVFAELGMTQYLDAFLEQGFDLWDTILDITESDLDALGVKLGHRRKLQRRIANARGIAPNTVLVSPLRPSIEESKGDPNQPDVTARHEFQTDVVAAKRKYRRHPKPDDNAPERPPSAYVLFSNKMREDLKGQNLSFTEIAKLVGENWQSISPEEKEPFESQAQQAKEKYAQELAEYKKTLEYRKYSQYLQDFKQKQANQSQVSDNAKRPKLEHMRIHHANSTSSAAATSGSGSLGGGSGSGSGSGSDSQAGSEPPPTRQQRIGSVASVTDSNFTNGAASFSSQQSLDEALRSPTSSQLESSLDGNPRDGQAQSRRGCRGHQSHQSHQSLQSLQSHQNPRHWKGPTGLPGEGKHQHLPSLSDMFDDQNLTGMPQPPENNAYGQYPSNRRHETRRDEGGRDILILRHPPRLRHDHSSNASSSSGNSAYGGVRGRLSTDASLSIHAFLSNKTSSSPSPPLLSGAPPQKPQQAEAQGPHPYRRLGQFSNGNGFGSIPPATSTDEETHLADRSSTGRTLPNRSGREEFDLDGMSALLAAGEIVGRRNR